MAATHSSGNGRKGTPVRIGRPTLRVVYRRDEDSKSRNVAGATSTVAPNVIPAGRLAHRMLRQWQTTSFIEELNTAG